MPQGLVRYQKEGDLHFVTFSCYERKPYLGTPAARDIFVRSLEVMRARYGFFVISYVVMPEHVHLLMTEPLEVPLAKALQALKLSVAVQNKQRPFWHKRYYDFNVFSERKVIEKRRYIHRNPVTRGLVESPALWAWSSFQHWMTGAEGPVEVESPWTARKRGGLPMRIDPDTGILQTHVSEARRWDPFAGLPRIQAVILLPHHGLENSLE